MTDWQQEIATRLRRDAKCIAAWLLFTAGGCAVVIIESYWNH